MDVRIGVTYAPKELTLEMDGTSEEIADAIRRSITEADGIAWFVDRRGRQLGVPLDKLAYVEIEGTADSRHVGFGSS